MHMWGSTWKWMWCLLFHSLERWFLFMGIDAAQTSWRSSSSVGGGSGDWVCACVPLCLCVPHFWRTGCKKIKGRYKTAQGPGSEKSLVSSSLKSRAGQGMKLDPLHEKPRDVLPLSRVDYTLPLCFLLSLSPSYSHSRPPTRQEDKTEMEKSSQL